MEQTKETKQRINIYRLEELPETERNNAIRNLQTIVGYFSTISPPMLDFLDDKENIAQMRLEYARLKRKKDYEPMSFPAFTVARYIGVLEALNEKYKKLSSNE